MILSFRKAWSSIWRISGFLESWPWQEKEEEPQSVEIESKEEENVEEDGFIGRESCMEWFWALERHEAVSEELQAF